MPAQPTETQPSTCEILAELKALRSELRKERAKLAGGWLDVTGAREYLGGMSLNTFDKYRYSKDGPRIEGFKLDGKTLYHPKELDNFVRLYELRKAGSV